MTNIWRTTKEERAKAKKARKKLLQQLIGLVPFVFSAIRSSSRSFIRKSLPILFKAFQKLKRLFIFCLHSIFHKSKRIFKFIGLVTTAWLARLKLFLLKRWFDFRKFILNKKITKLRRPKVLQRRGWFGKPKITYRPDDCEDVQEEVLEEEEEEEEEVEIEVEVSEKEEGNTKTDFIEITKENRIDRPFD